MKRKRLTAAQRERVLDDAGRVCHLCGGRIQAGEAWDVSHVIALEAGGTDEPANTLPAHRTCHRQHTSEHDAPLIAKTRRQRQKHLGIKRATRPMPGSKASPWRKRLDGSVQRRTP